MLQEAAINGAHTGSQLFKVVYKTATSNTAAHNFHAVVTGQTVPGWWKTAC